MVDQPTNGKTRGQLCRAPRVVCMVVRDDQVVDLRETRVSRSRQNAQTPRDESPNREPNDKIVFI